MSGQAGLPVLESKLADHAAISGKNPSISAYFFGYVAFFAQIVKLRRLFIYSPRPRT